MKVKMKNVKLFETLSHENPCFTASIWVDGKRAGSVENDGKGGEHRINFKDGEVLADLKSLVKRIQVKPTELFPQGFDMDIDTYINLLLDRELEIKRLFGFLKEGCLVRLVDTPSGCWLIQEPNSDASEAHCRRKNDHITDLLRTKQQVRDFVEADFADEIPLVLGWIEPVKSPSKAPQGATLEGFIEFGEMLVQRCV